MNGDAIVVNSRAGAEDLWRIDLSSPNNEAGDYGLLGRLPTGASLVFGIAIDAAGDAIIVDTGLGGGLWRIDLSDPSSEAGDYGLIGAVPSALTNINGIALVTRTVNNFGAWTNIATLPASTFPAGNLSEGDTDTDVEGDDYTVVADGGWRDVTVSIPTTYQQIRLRPNLNAGGMLQQQDIALRSIRA